MKKKCIVSGVVLLAVMMFIYCPLAFAEGSSGFRIFASDAEALAKGGAFVGEADNASAVLYNPAGMTQLKGKQHVSIGMAAIQPLVEHESATTETQARINTFLLPHVYYVNDFGFEDIVFGIGATTSWGLGTDWAEDSFSRYHATKTELENIDTMLTGAYRINDQLSIGAGVTVDYSKINKEKMVNQGAAPNAEGQLKGDDVGVGYKVAAMYKVNDQHQFGLTYRSEIALEYDGNVTATGFNDTGGTTYAALFGGASYSTKFQADLTIPQGVVLGYSFTPNDKWRFNFDVDWTDWSTVESENVSFPEETNATRVATLKALTDSDRDWESTVSFQLGGEYQWRDHIALRAGYFYNPTPIPNGTFDTSVPINDVHGVNLGVGYEVKPDMTVDLTWSGLIYPDKTVDNTVGSALTANLDGTYENFTNIITLTFNWAFE